MARSASGIFGSEQVENISKHYSIGALLEVEMLKSARFVARSACRSQSAKMLKTSLGRTASGSKTAHNGLLNVQSPFSVASARDSALYQK